MSTAWSSAAVRQCESQGTRQRPPGHQAVPRYRARRIRDNFKAVQRRRHAPLPPLLLLGALRSSPRSAPNQDIGAAIPRTSHGRHGTDETRRPWHRQSLVGCRPSKTARPRLEPNEVLVLVARSTGRRRAQSRRRVDREGGWRSPAHARATPSPVTFEMLLVRLRFSRDDWQPCSRETRATMEIARSRQFAPSRRTRPACAPARSSPDRNELSDAGLLEQPRFRAVGDLDVVIAPRPAPGQPWPARCHPPCRGPETPRSSRCPLPASGERGCIFPVRPPGE